MVGGKASTRAGKQNEKVAELEIGELESLIAKTVQDALKPIAGSLGNLTKEISDLKIELKAKDDKIRQLESFVETKLDELEQYGRRNNLRIFGVPERAEEPRAPNTDTDSIVVDVASKMGVVLDPSLIDRSHRVGNRDSQQRPIIVKFVGYGPRGKMFGAKKELKHTKITVREDLTVRRLKNVWTRDGVIKINVGLSTPANVRTHQELKQLLLRCPPETCNWKTN
ncbi:LINE-1 retrotransposable element ORF1 protein [Frankliniella fusca]|uniref:LINE-1 retrotransposable element ORF1 protein n=1 Tax=Frankliniella fusca TaxID=407009 RepID=A0AAE1HC38_9NEOP|nr:LINE-1 retrotransposable element ORF1 protein [Frankliniella fusca]